MTDVQIAYLAGLFDGEGCANVVPYKASKNGLQYNRLTARITNTHNGVLTWVREATGYGNISREVARVGLQNRKPCFRWCVTNANAATFLRMIRPHLIIKAGYVDKLLAGQIAGRVAA